MKSRNRALFVGAGTAFAALAASQPAAAQAVDLFARDRGVAVKDRPHPEYEALGSRFGSWLVYPKVQADVGYDSNVLASEANEISDTVWTVAPEAEVESDWARHSITAFARGRVIRYVDNSSENTDTWSIGGAGRYDIQRGRNIRGDVSYAREVESRTASNTPTSIAEPIEYDRFGATAGTTWTFNRLRFVGTAGLETYDYEDGVTVSGVIVPQDTRDQTTTTATLRADYALSPATAVFVQVEGNRRRFEIGDALTPLRDSDGLNFLTGANFELTELVRGDVGVGYISQSYDNPLYGELSGFSGRARLEYFLTQLITLGLNANRSVTDSGIIGSAGILTSRYEATADYEFRRNVIVEGRLGLIAEEFDTIDRDNDTYYAGLRATYLLNRSVGVTGSYAYETRNSSGAEAIGDYDAHRLIVSLVLQY